jgi:hypothetical protein
VLRTANSSASSTPRNEPDDTPNLVPAQHLSRTLNSHHQPLSSRNTLNRDPSHGTTPGEQAGNLSDKGLTYTLMLLVGCLFIGVSEELMFRGIGLRLS